MTDRYTLAEAAGKCECGVKLATHKPLPPPPPLASWKSQRVIPMSFGGVRSTWTDAQQAARRKAAGRKSAAASRQRHERQKALRVR